MSDPSLSDSNSKESRILSALRSYFLTGIVVTAPVGLSLYIVWAILTWIDKKVGDVLSLWLVGRSDIPGFGVILALTFFILVGMLTQNFVGRLLLNISNYVMGRLPIVKTLYSAFKQVFEMAIGKKAQAFRDAVLVTYPHKGTYTIGFLMGKTGGEVPLRAGQELMSVYIPTIPIPTSGFLIFVPPEDVIDLDMSVDDALKMLISGGMITPDYVAKREKQLTPSGDS